MKNIKLIIDIPEEIYIEKKEDYIGDTLDRAIANGTPLEEELEKIKEKVKQRKILPKTSARSNYEMGLIDGRSTEKVAIIYIIEKEIAELKGENNVTD